MNIGVALPDWMFSTDRRVAPLMLLGLVGFGILLPLVAASWYMLSSNRYVGSGGIMTDTLAIYMHSKFNIKESQVRPTYHAQPSSRQRAQLSV